MAPAQRPSAAAGPRAAATASRRPPPAAALRQRRRPYLSTAALLAGCGVLLACAALLLALLTPSADAAAAPTTPALSTAATAAATPVGISTAQSPGLPADVAAAPAAPPLAPSRNSREGHSRHSAPASDAPSNMTRGSSSVAKVAMVPTTTAQAELTPPPEMGVSSRNSFRAAAAAAAGGGAAVPSGNNASSGSPSAAASAAGTARRMLLQSSSGGGGGCCNRLGAGSVGFSPGGVPLLLIDTRGIKIESKEASVKANVCSCSPSGGTWDGVPYTDFQAEASIKLRGSSSVQNNKKSYNLKFRAPSPRGGMSKLMVPLLGMPADDEWALYGPETDKTLGMRNVLAYDIFRRMGRWGPRTRFCEVFLLDDGSGSVAPSHYVGVFVATERITVGPERVNIRKMDPDKDLSGGYVLGYENDNIDPDDLTFRPSTSLLNFVMHEPTFEDQALQGGRKSGHPTPREAAALRWITAYVEQMEGALLAGFQQAPALRARAGTLSSQGLTAGLPNGYNGPTTAAAVGGPGGPPPASTGGWGEFIEVGSFIDYFLATELYKNPDGYRGSVYMSKNVGSPIAFGPPWDYNEAFGVCCGYPIEGFDNGGKSWGSSGGSAISAEGWRFNICDQPLWCKADPIDGISQYFRSAWRDSAMRSATGQRWQQLRAGQLSDGVLAGMVDAQTNLIRGAAIRDYDRWAAIRDSPFFKSRQEQWEYEVGQLRSWLLARARWMDGVLADAAQGGWGGGGAAPAPAGGGGSAGGAGGGGGGGGGSVLANASQQVAGRFMSMLFGRRR
ncbi:hypothetical protein PLESTB_001710500 [Pleodorina starrii]|uniref:Uncharacterized protein n=1 Tax=Pleodorina starrii TaxID=330485 RepID=A0A9W6F9T0_9CHLO|nr:hypothetical protein PLESTB_001710500 [Pleodorina starrii]